VFLEKKNKEEPFVEDSQNFFEQARQRGYVYDKSVFEKYKGKAFQHY